jgi:DNA-binding transcriptional regulator YiaG
MAKNFKTLRAQMSPEHQAEAAAQTAAMLADLPLQELRQARQFSQEALATTLNATQSSVSKMERRADMYVSTLRKFVEAMGGELEIRAKFPDGDVRISRFGDLGDPSDVFSETGHATAMATHAVR